MAPKGEKLPLEGWEDLSFINNFMPGVLEHTFVRKQFYAPGVGSHCWEVRKYIPDVTAGYRELPEAIL